MANFQLMIRTWYGTIWITNFKSHHGKYHVAEAAETQHRKTN